jgi:RHS repeat-associated protein
LPEREPVESGEQYDPNLANLGLYNLRARYFNQATGRFMTMDPYEVDNCQACACTKCIDTPATLHNYLYTAGNPVNWIDPSGRAAMVDYARQLAAVMAFTTAVLATNYEYRNHVVGNFVVALVQKIVDYEKCRLQFIADEANC